MKQEGLPLVAKRVLDCAIAGVGLVVTLPVLAAAAVAVRLSMGRPVLFRQQRPGRHGRPFRLVKLRTMSDRRDELGRLLPNELRLTKTGLFLRATSVDELPQLWNVLRGDMSLVGPRPLLMKYLDRYTAEQARRHDVLPGITGWAQVNGRNAIDWERKFELDNWYVDNWSPALDLKILALTASRVLQREGISHEQAATMPEFLGSTPERRPDAVVLPLHGRLNPEGR